MIGWLRGKVVAEFDDRLILDIGGVGYEVVVPPYQLRYLRARHLPADDPRARLMGVADLELFIYEHVPERRPVPVLFGFADPNERKFFETLAGVIRLGPTAAAKSMIISVPDYASLIMTRDTRSLMKLPGIGAGKAEQIIAQVRGKMATFAMMQQEKIPERMLSAADDLEIQAQIALEDLGYRTPEAEAMVQSARAARPDAKNVEELLDAVWAASRDRGRG